MRVSSWPSRAPGRRAREATLAGSLTWLTFTSALVGLLVSGTLLAVGGDLLLRAEVHGHVQALADSIAAELQGICDDYLLDHQRFASRPLLREAVATLAAAERRPAGAIERTRQSVTQQLEQLTAPAQMTGQTAVVVRRADGRVLAWTGVANHAQAMAVAAQARRCVPAFGLTPRLSRVHPQPGTGKPVLDIIGPIPAVGGDASSPAAVLVWSVPLQCRIYGPIERQCPAHRTSETVLVDDRGVVLHDLRHEADAVLRKTITTAPARRGIAGRRGGLALRDHRGVLVVAGVARVPGTGWGIVQKMDLAEAYRGPLRLLLLWLGLTLLLALAAFASLALQQLEAHHELILQARELAASNRELEAFSYSVAHDLRAPLRAIDGFTRALLTKCGSALDAEGQHYLGRIQAASQRLGELIDDLLELSRVSRDPMRWEPVSLSAAAEAIVQQLRQAEPERVVEVLIAENLVSRGHPALLHTLLLNLLVNAWKFTSHEEHPRIEFGHLQRSDGLIYFVRDNGAGFDMRYASKLFMPFQRLHAAEEFPGHGIGLATVQRVINRHGGCIWAEARVGGGATFYFTLAEEQPFAATGTGGDLQGRDRCAPGRVRRLAPADR